MIFIFSGFLLEEGKEEHYGILKEFVEHKNTEHELPSERTVAWYHYLGSKRNSGHRINTQVMYHTDD